MNKNENITKDAIDAARSAIQQMVKNDNDTALFYKEQEEKEKNSKRKNNQKEIQNITLTYNPKDFDGTEESLWTKIASDLVSYDVPYLAEIHYGKEVVRVSMMKEFEPRVQGTLELKKGIYPKAWYQKVDIETNAYQFFKIIPYNLGPMTLMIGGSYGRIGSTKRDLDHERFIKNPYQGCVYWLLRAYLEKDGYTDMSDILFEEEEKNAPEVMEIKDSVSVELYNKLKMFAKGVLEAQVANIDFLSEKSPYTKAQVKKAWKLWTDLSKSKDVKSFNKTVLKLMEISPRKVDKYRNTLESLLAKEVSDPEEQKRIFAEIIDREESLIRAMDAVTNSTVSTDKTQIVSPFGNIDVREATKDEIDMVKSHMSDQLKPLVKNVYAVTPYDQMEKMAKYLEERKIKNTKFLWHGSRNENWISIIKNSLMLNPNAVITGKMFGYGIYFAPSSMKSWGYTSFTGTRWANGASTTAYMGLYETAYGTPYFPKGRVDGTKKMLDSMIPPCDCIHAKAASCGLYNDEIIYYDEAAMCLKYLVEFQGE